MSSKLIVPPLKCQGKKTKLVPWITQLLPANFTGRWIEPFMGSGSVAFNVKPASALLSDSNPHIISFYQKIASGSVNSEVVKEFLSIEGENLLKSQGSYYYDVRDRFNDSGSSYDFLFLNRSCFNGVMRFNSKGNFNVPFCKNASRFSKALITKICNQIDAVSNIIANGNFQFLHTNFEEAVSLSESKDVLYCDPPYIGRHTDYYNRWNEDEEKKLYEMLCETSSRFMLSTWDSDSRKSNPHLQKYKTAHFNIHTRQHTYHVGPKTSNRPQVLEAVVTNF